MTQTSLHPLPYPMKIIVRSNAVALFSSGQVVVNLRRHPADQQARKMDLALSTFRAYGWAIEDQRNQKPRATVA